MDTIAQKSTGWPSRKLRSYPATIALLLVACIVTGLGVAKYHSVQARLKRDGVVLEKRESVYLLAWPLVFCLYVVTQVGGSLAVGFVSGIVGMVVAYGVSGLLFDLILQRFCTTATPAPRDSATDNRP